MLRYLWIMLAVCGYCSMGNSQQIILDDDFEDWNTEVSRYTDKQGDVGNGRIDFTDIRISNDDTYLYIYFDVTQEINLQEDNNIALILDFDNDINTGKKTVGLGADIIYNFGKRQGFLYAGNSSYLIYQSDIKLVTSPTVTSKRFEIAIARNFIFNNETFSMGNLISAALSDESSYGDRAPDTEGGFVYEFKKAEPYDKSVHLSKTNPAHLRIMSYNVLKDRLFNNSVYQNYNRIFNAIQPDIIGFCEIYDNSSAQVAALIERFLPSVSNQKWYHASGNPDIRLVSRYPILSVRSIDGNAAFLIDLGKDKLVAIMAHLPCCNNESSRQQEVDNIMSFVRGIRYGISAFQVPVNTPIIIMGDMNFVGYSQQLHTFITGDIVNNQIYGPDFSPDWDNADLKDLKPLTTGQPMTYTWYSTGSYSPGRLDYMIYTGSAMQASNSFALWTQHMSSSDLSRYHLDYNDVTRASDHAPVVGDFTIGSFSATENSNHQKPFVFIQRDGQWLLDTEQRGRLTITDVSGRIIWHIDKDDTGSQSIQMPELSGLYILTFHTGTGIYSTTIFR